MSAKSEIDNLLNRFLQLETDEQREQFRDTMAQILVGKTEEEKHEFGEALADNAKETIQQSEALIGEYHFKQALHDIFPAITWSYIAEEYFHKSRSWLSQRMNGYHVNSKAAAFSPEDINTLADGLLDLSERIKKSAILLKGHRF